jgi:uncharacterized glyoxalase superfamily protein PhnB
MTEMKSDIVMIGVWPTLVYHDGQAALKYEKATAAGATVVREMRDEDYGSRGFTVADSEGNMWSIGTYSGETGASSTGGQQ